MPVGKGEELLPVVGGQVVVAVAHVVADGAADRLIDGRHRVDAQPGRAEQPVDGFGRLRRQELAAGIGPLIVRGGSHI